jgi:hypothetical protein
VSAVGAVFVYLLLFVSAETCKVVGIVRRCLGDRQGDERGKGEKKKNEDSNVGNARRCFVVSQGGNIDVKSARGMGKSETATSFAKDKCRTVSF